MSETTERELAIRPAPELIADGSWRTAWQLLAMNDRDGWLPYGEPELREVTDPDGATWTAAVGKQQRLADPLD